MPALHDAEFMGEFVGISFRREIRSAIAHFASASNHWPSVDSGAAIISQTPLSQCLLSHSGIPGCGAGAGFAAADGGGS